MSGTCIAFQTHAPDTRLIGAEPEGADDAYRSLEAGRIIPSSSPNTVCDGLLTSLGDLTFPILQRLCGSGIVVTEEEALKAMGLIFQRLKVVAEPGGAVAVAAALFHGDKIEGDDVIAVISGGNVDADMFQRALETL